MNLRKDHSHASNNTTVNSGREVLLGDGDACIDAPLQKLKGGRAGWVLCHLLSVLVVTFLLRLLLLLQLYILKWLSTLLFYNFQRSMSRLEQR